jgi:uncharacterized protein involved in exopolysaccharide biosynthesis
MYRLFVTIAYRKWLILLITALVFAGVAALTFKMQPMYKATAALQLAPDTRQFLDVTSTGEGLKLNETAFYKTQYEILAGQTLSERVVDKLGLKMEQIARKAVFGGAAQAEETTPERSRAELLKLFGEQLKVSPVENSQIVYVSFAAPDKALAAQVANTFVDEYVQFSRESYDVSVKQAKTTVLEKIDAARQSLQQTEDNVQQFAAKKELVVTKDDTNPYLDSVVKLNQEMMLAEKERVAAETALQNGAGDVGSTSAVLDNNFVQQLKGRQADLQAQYEKNLETFKPNYPDMIQLRQQITEIDKKLAAESGSFKKNLQLNYEARKKQEAEMKRMLEKSSAQYQSYLKNMASYGKLTRDLEVEKAMYESLLKRLKEIDVASGVNLNNISVLEKASVPQFAYSPNYLVNLSMGGIIALLLGISIAGIMDFRDGRIKTREDLLGLPMQKLPMLEKLDRKMLTRSGSAEMLMLPSRNTVASLQVGSQRGQMRIISLLALGKDDKHVAFMFNLISFFLKKKLKVILLAMDEDHAAVRKQVQIEREGELFVVDASRPILINKTEREGLAVSLLNVDELFTGLGDGGQFGSIMHALAGRFDLVLLMSTDVGQHPEVIPELDASDVILVNVLKRKTDTQELERLVTRLERLPNAGFSILHDL